MTGRKRTPSLVDSLAADTREGAAKRDQFPDRLKRYGQAKGKALAISEYINSEHPSQARLAIAIKECGNYLVFRDYYTAGEIRLSKACFCKKHLLCPLCAIRRGAKHLSRYLDRFHAVIDSKPLLKPYMVTLTVKDGEHLKERFTHLQKSLQKYHKRRHRKNAPCEASKAYGAVWSYEVKRGKNSGAWHPHVHAVWLCADPPNQTELSSEWHSITGDSFIVDVRPIDPVSPVSGFLEVFKYAVKFSDQPEADTWHCFDTLRGKRLIGSFGEFYGIPEPDDLADDPLEGLPYIEYFFAYVKGGYHLQGSDVSARTAKGGAAMQADASPSAPATST